MYDTLIVFLENLVYKNFRADFLNYFNWGLDSQDFLNFQKRMAKLILYNFEVINLLIF